MAVEHDGQITARYQYDPFGRRIRKTIGSAQSAQTTWFVYSNEGLLAEIDPQCQTTKAYGWQPGSDWGTEPLWQADHANGTNASGPTYHYLHNDHLSTPQVASDATGQPSWQALSESFGQTLQRSGNRTQMNLRFAGQYFDEETGTHYNYYRDYSPVLGRYLQTDPIEITGGLNKYIYSKKNPLIYIDPFGLIKICTIPGGCIETDPPPITDPDCPPSSGTPSFEWPKLLPDWLVDGLMEMSKGGNQNQKDTGLIGVTDSEIEKKLKDPNTSANERKRLVKEQKARGNRNKSKRNK
ncbi:RHS repeat domain-containing protein [Delftia sp. PS-11]|uniref:RHS repeat domain-containing protein n=1 Tax=Delftia sp. PS-11 TaxID=2767222 RepID=UPI003AB30B32